MSQVTLMNAIKFKPTSNAPDQMEIDNVPTPGVKLPEDGVTFFYGFNESQEELRLEANVAHKEKLYSSTVNILVETGDQEDNAISTIDNLPNSRMLNLIRMSKALEAVIIDHWSRILEEKGIELSRLPANYWKRGNFAAHHPQYLSELRKCEGFEHLDIIVFPFENPNISSASKRAVLFSNDNIVKVECMTNPEIQIKIPKLENAQRNRMKFN